MPAFTAFCEWAGRDSRPPRRFVAPSRACLEAWEEYATACARCLPFIEAENRRERAPRVPEAVEV